MDKLVIKTPIIHLHRGSFFLCPRAHPQHHPLLLSSPAFGSGLYLSSTRSSSILALCTFSPRNLFLANRELGPGLITKRYFFNIVLSVG